MINRPRATVACPIEFWILHDFHLAIICNQICHLRDCHCLYTHISRMFHVMWIIRQTNENTKKKTSIKCILSAHKMPRRSGCFFNSFFSSFPICSALLLSSTKNQNSFDTEAFKMFVINFFSRCQSSGCTSAPIIFDIFAYCNGTVKWIYQCDLCSMLAA